jgi:translation initiation factor 2B subunit (eIF-2B alpha/beta/delta family)
MQVLADGGLLATSGSRMIALAAKTHSVPLFVLLFLFRLHCSM